MLLTKRGMLNVRSRALKYALSHLGISRSFSFALSTFAKCFRTYHGWPCRSGHQLKIVSETNTACCISRWDWLLTLNPLEESMVAAATSPSLMSLNLGAPQSHDFPTLDCELNLVFYGIFDLVEAYYHLCYVPYQLVWVINNGPQILFHPFLLNINKLMTIFPKRKAIATKRYDTRSRRLNYSATIAFHMLCSPGPWRIRGGPWPGSIINIGWTETPRSPDGPLEG